LCLTRLGVCCVLVCFCLCSIYKIIHILPKGRPPEPDPLHSLYTNSVVLTHKKLSRHHRYCSATTRRYDLCSTAAPERWSRDIHTDLIVL
jgi:hypothetical protein